MKLQDLQIQARMSAIENALALAFAVIAQDGENAPATLQTFREVLTHAGQTKLARFATMVGATIDEQIALELAHEQTLERIFDGGEQFIPTND
ncbi:hypothetical protein [Paraburkholderia sediminicola]|uniref:hypothetical protein n=1 Tax=Paraburkholderia sediminicola TaxID=458836 RepID=UPI0038BC35FC